MDQRCLSGWLDGKINQCGAGAKRIEDRAIGAAILRNVLYLTDDADDAQVESQGSFKLKAKETEEKSKGNT